MTLVFSKLRFNLLILRNVLFREMEYRAHYYIMLLSLFISFSADYLILKFSHGGRNSYISSEQILSFVIMGLIVRTASVLWGQSLTFESEIRNGNFRRYLLQPVNFPEIFFSTATGEKFFTWVMMFIGYLILLLWIGTPDIVIPHWSFLPFLMLSIALTWSIYYSITLLAFWLHESSFMNIAFNLGVGIFSGTLVPLDWLPLVVQKIIPYTPLLYIGDVPMRAAFSTMSLPETLRAFAIGLSWLLGIAAINALLFKKGVRRYESFGG